MAAAVRAKLPPKTIDLSDIYDGNGAPIFIDMVHTNEVGAAIVAEEIFTRIRPALEKHYRTRAPR
jgi:hypothetical protein